MTVRIVLAEDSLLIREGAIRLLEAQPDIEVCAACEDLPSLLDAIAEHEPDVVVTDVRMPPEHTDEGIRAAEHLRDTSPQTGVVVLSQFADPVYVMALLERGSERRAYLLKERLADAGQLTAAIHEVAHGGSMIDQKVIDALVQSSAGKARSPLEALTTREREILSEMAQGKNNAGIAATLFVTDRAVEKHINSIFSKLGLSEEQDVHRRVKAVLLFLAG